MSCSSQVTKKIGSITHLQVRCNRNWHPVRLQIEGLAYHAWTYNVHVTTKEINMTLAVERIVVQTSKAYKRAITTKAKRLGFSVGELMRRSAEAYTPSEQENETIALAEAAFQAAERAGAAIDDANNFVAESNKRIEAMERAAAEKSQSSMGMQS